MQATHRNIQRILSRMDVVLPANRENPWLATSFPQPLRGNQDRAISAFESARLRGKSRFYFVLPPGSGKTVLGLELARRVGRPVVCLSPNSAIQEQWVKTWRQFTPPLLSASDDPALTHPVTSLTYQAVCAIDTSAPSELPPPSDPNDAAAAAHARRKHLLAHGSDDEILTLLHPAGQKLVAMMAGDESGGDGASVGWTLVLDECHHLIVTWGRLLEVILSKIRGDATVIGLTATPPTALAEHDANLYTRLFGSPDLYIPTPAVVKDGFLAPYQELVQVTEPLPSEQAFIASFETRFQEMLTTMSGPEIAAIPLVAWVGQRFEGTIQAHELAVSLHELETTLPDLFVAGMRFFLSSKGELPRGAPMREAFRLPMRIEDWVLLINDWYLHHIARSTDERDIAAGNILKTSLESLGYRITRVGIQHGMSLVDQVVSLSSSKAAAVITILGQESTSLGDTLRALILCDFDAGGHALAQALTGVLDPLAGSAALVLSTLSLDPDVRLLNPVLVTGGTVACNTLTLPVLRTILEPLGGDIKTFPLLGSESPNSSDGSSIVRIEGSAHWSPRFYLPLITEAFEAGTVKALVGTRALLGEGWDAPRVNVLIDLTSATTHLAITQMRGRSLRLDPHIPRKVANNWDVVCIDALQKGGDSDYQRLVKKHEGYYSLNASGALESGIAHLHPRLAPYGPPDNRYFAEINAAAIIAAARREEAYVAWKVGQPYANIETSTLRIAVREDLAPQLHQVPPSTAPLAIAHRDTRSKSRLITAVTTIVGLICGAVLLGTPAGMIGGTLVGLGFGFGIATVLVRPPVGMLHRSDTTLLIDIGRAIAQSLGTEHLISSATNDVVVQIESDGFYRCHLVSDNVSDSAIFTQALEESLSPLAAPKYLVTRAIPRKSRAPWRWIAPWARQPNVVYHAVPTALATIPKGTAFAANWSVQVTPTTLIHTSDPLGAAILEVQRGQDLFAAATQMRKLWS